MNPVPRVAAVHDLSCFGRCSMTVIMPILSCMGIQVCPLPTAVLSTHLGGFSNLAFCDFTKHMPDFFRHWQKEGVEFDCIYSGFLASEEQIDIVSCFIDEFSRTRPFILVDPVMGDEGRLYSTYTAQMQNQMKQLVKKADLITPNYTEACFLLGEPYQHHISDDLWVRDWLRRLADFGPATVVMTGVHIGNQIITYGYSRETETFCEVATARINARYPGTGDAFASVLAGSLLMHEDLSTAMYKAAGFVAEAMKLTFAAQTPPREGILLERVLPWLCRRGETE